MPYKNIHEEELKNKVAKDWFAGFDCSQIIGNLDFYASFKGTQCVWAEAKANKRDVIVMFAQLILTIGKARTFDKHHPPKFLGVFDAEKIAFVEYDKVQHLFYQNDFNWNITPSNVDSKEFKQIKILIEDLIEKQTFLYDYEKDEKELKFFIKNNLSQSDNLNKIQIDKNNFVPIYLRWLDEIKTLDRL